MCFRFALAGGYTAPCDITCAAYTTACGAPTVCSGGLSAVLVKEKAGAQLHAFGSLSVLSRVRKPAPGGVARTVVLLPTAPPALAPPATSTVLPLAARAAGRFASFPPVVVPPQAPVLPLAPVAVAAPAAAAAAAGAGVGGAGQAETKEAKRSQG